MAPKVSQKPPKRQKTVAGKVFPRLGVNMQSEQAEQLVFTEKPFAKSSQYKHETAQVKVGATIAMN